MKNIFILVTLLSLSACSDGPGSAKVLSDAGYTNIVTTGYSMFSCGDGDSWSTGFEATGPTGKHVTGVVCSGFLKGSTIRLF